MKGDLLMPAYDFIPFATLEPGKESIKRKMHKGKYVHFVKLKEALEIIISGKKEVFNALCTLNRQLIFIESDDDVMQSK